MAPRCARRRPLLFKTLCSVPLVVALLTVWVRGLWASPLDDPHVGGISFQSPTAASLGGLYWNPATVGLLRGNQLALGGTFRYSRTQVDRAPIDGATGMPGGSYDPGSARSSQLIHPFHRQIPPTPGGFLAAATDLQGDRFTLAAGMYVPFSQQVSFPVGPSAAEDGPTRYQMLTADLRHVAIVPALSIRVSGDLRIGVAPGFLLSTGHIRFSEDTALHRGTTGTDGVENPQMAARYDVSSGLSLFDSTFNFTLAAGIYHRWNSLAVGLAFSSRPLGGGLSGVRIQGRQVGIERPAANGGGAFCPPDESGAPSRCLSAEVVYRLPAMITGGVSWYITTQTKLEVFLRWLELSVHDRMEIRLVGPAQNTLAEAGLPSQVTLYRGFQDVFDLRLRLAFAPNERLRFAIGMRAETSAVPRRNVNAAAVDGFKLEPILSAKLRVAPWLTLSAGYAFLWMPQVAVADSVFSPLAAVECDQRGGDLDHVACQKQLMGAARPTAAGTYHLVRHTLGFGAEFSF